MITQLPSAPGQLNGTSPKLVLPQLEGPGTRPGTSLRATRPGRRRPVPLHAQQPRVHHRTPLLRGAVGMAGLFCLGRVGGQGFGGVGNAGVT